MKTVRSFGRYFFSFWLNSTKKNTGELHLAIANVGKRNKNKERNLQRNHSFWTRSRRFSTSIDFLSACEIHQQIFGICKINEKMLFRSLVPVLRFSLLVVRIDEDETKKNDGKMHVQLNLKVFFFSLFFLFCFILIWCASKNRITFPANGRIETW